MNIRKVGRKSLLASRISKQPTLLEKVLSLMLTRRPLLQTALLLPGLLGMLLQAAHAQETQEGRSPQSGDSTVVKGTSEPFIRNEFGDEYFISSSDERRIVQSYAAISLDHNAEEQPAKPVKTASSRLRRIEARIGTRMIQPDFDHIPGRTKEILAAKIKKAVLSILAEEKIDPSTIQGQRFLAQGVCDWVRTHIVYNLALMPDPSTGKYNFPTEVLRRFWTTDLLLKEPTLFAVCAGISRTTLDLSRAVGLNCELVLCFVRNVNNTHTETRNHAFNVFTFIGTDGTRVFCPTDNTYSLVLLSRARELGHVPPNPYCLPDNPTELGLFLWSHQGTGIDRDLPLPKGVGLSRLSIDEWKGLPRDQIMEGVLSKVSREANKAVLNIPLP